MRENWKMSSDRDEFVRKRKADVNDYENLLKALIIFKKYLEEKLGARFYFGGKLKSGTNPDQTPDTIIELKDNFGLLGETKRSLVCPPLEGSKEEFIQRYIEGDLIKQIKKYDSDFDNLRVKG